MRPDHEVQSIIRDTRIKTAILNHPIKQLYRAYNEIGVELQTGTKYEGCGKRDEMNDKYYIIRDMGRDYTLLVIDSDDVVCSWYGDFNKSAIAGERFDVELEP